MDHLTKSQTANNSISNGNNHNENHNYNQSNSINDALSKDSKRKRRSKNEAEGRSFQCECGKAYLSAPALTNHKKNKAWCERPTVKARKRETTKKSYSKLSTIREFRAEI